MSHSAPLAHLGLQWRKSSYSQGQDDCIEIALLPAGAVVRDSKNQLGGVLRLPVSTWSLFRRAVQGVDDAS